ncbi:MAG: class I SAM-dependent methyltransferase, partial [Clostridia bacterium]|nr:class I SAM-dependent methyltransferase [Clostridia bacterium]
DMRVLELYGTVGAPVCCIDSLNYLLDINDLQKTVSLVHNYSDPDALFIFDVNTPYKFENVYSNNAYVLEDENEDGGAIYCGWQNFYDRETKMCDFYLSVFEENGDGSYWREDEQQKERCYTQKEIESILSVTGFELLGIYSDYRLSAVADDTERWYFVARAKK